MWGTHKDTQTKQKSRPSFVRWGATEAIPTAAVGLEVEAAGTLGPRTSGTVARVEGGQETSSIPTALARTSDHVRSVRVKVQS